MTRSKEIVPQEPVENFPGSKTRHGTHSGFTKHVKAGERPCDPCYRAKEAYDDAYRGQPQQVIKKRLAARAQGRASMALRQKYPEEYKALYAQFKAEIEAEES